MKKVFYFIDRTFKSVKFSMLLMLFIAIASVYGTIYPAKGPYDFNLYKTPYFIALLFIFAVNTFYCTIYRVLPHFKSKFKRVNFVGERYYIKSQFLDFKEIILRKGFEIEELEDGFIARKGKFKGVLILTIHIAVIIILIGGGLSSLTSFLGTVNIHVGDEIDLVFDWDEKKDVKLPFKINPESLFIDYYPMDIKILIEDTVKGDQKEFITKEGKIVNFSGKNIKIEKADPSSISVFFKVNGSDELFRNETGDGIKISLKAYMDPIIRQYYCTLVLRGSEGEIRKKISINDPLDYKGYKFYLIETGKDPFGFDYVGIQITKDVFQYIIWFGSVLLSISLILYPFVQTKAFRVVKKGEFLEITT